MYIPSYSQGKRLKQAHEAYQAFAYPTAVRLYEEMLKSKEIDTAHEKEVLSNLAMSYKKLQDFRNADFTYKELFKKYEDVLKPEDYLSYAQVLSSLDKKREAQRLYSKYGEHQSNDLRAKRFSIAYMDLEEFYKDSALYKIKYMEGINTIFPDFSPMYYENGLVFVSGRKETGAVKRIFTQNETPFLDLFWAATSEKPDYDALNSASLSSGDDYAGGKDNPRYKNNDFKPEDIENFSKKINSKYHEGPFTFFKGYKKIIFTRNSDKSNKNGVKMLKLYIADKKGKDWGGIQELPFNSEEYSTGHPALSPDNRRLYFVSDMPGGFGGTDIYMIDYKDGVWGKPENLGKNINTEGNEMFPFVDAIGNLYFASDGLAGLGGLDIFYSHIRMGMPFGQPQNLGAPINSPLDDFGLIADSQGKSGFFSSNRKKGYADDNIYAFEKGCKELQLLVYDNETKTPIQDVELRSARNGINGMSYITNSSGIVSVCIEKGHDFSFKTFKEGYKTGTVTYGTLSNSFTKKQMIKIFLDKTDRPMVAGNVVSDIDEKPIVGAKVTLTNESDGSEATVITGEDGKYAFQPQGDGAYSMRVDKDFHTSNTEKIGFLEKNKKNILLNKNFGMIAEYDIISLNNIYFDRDKSEIRADAKRELDLRIVPLLQKHKGLKLELKAHTDSRSSAEYNQLLSEERALAVRRYLVGKGISSYQLISSAVGESELINNCGEDVDCNENQHQRNRRLEFKVVAVGNDELTLNR
ncbi:MAG: OmpA family protein [Leadbetterella sp.]